MRSEKITDFRSAMAADQAIDVSIVMPCLNEIDCLPHCLANAQQALRMLQDQYGLLGEIVVADNGSTDGSQALATGLGARVIEVAERGYGSALISGGKAAFGRYVLMGDSDGSYDFTDGVAMIRALHEGADLCMGSRFKGGIAPGAMPWKNRHIGNPVLTGILNILFRAGIDDAHCGLRAIRKEAFLRLGLTGSGMEFASEMVIKAALMDLVIVEAPAKLLVDLRNRPPHLRPWRDGWRHLRYLLMSSPTWLFGAPALAGALLGFLILGAALVEGLVPGSFPAVGNYWEILGAALVGTSHMAGLLVLAGNLYGVRAGYRRGRRSARMSRAVSLETMLLGGGGALLLGVGTLLAVFWSWQDRHFAATYNVLPAVIGTLGLTLGIQNIFGGFLLAIIGGNEARFFAETVIMTSEPESNLALAA